MPPRAAGYTERSSYTVAGAHFDWSAVLAAGGSLSLFADRQIIEIRIPSGKPGKDGGAALQQIAEAARGNDSTLTLVMLPRLDKATRTGAWFSALEAQGMTLQIDPIERGQLPAWIAQRLAAQGQRVAPGEEGQRTLQFFADRVEGNLLAAHQEIQKLALLHPAGELSQAQVEQAVLNVARYDVFKLSGPCCPASWRAFRACSTACRPRARPRCWCTGPWPRTSAPSAASRTPWPQVSLPMALRAQRVWGVKERLFERLLPRITDAQAARLLQSAHAVDGIVKGLAFEGWPATAGRPCAAWPWTWPRPAPRADVPFLARLFQLRLGLGGPGLEVSSRSFWLKEQLSSLNSALDSNRSSRLSSTSP